MRDLEIKVYPNPVLTAVAEEITEFDEKLEDLIKDMGMALLKYKGLGLSAPQVGISKRILVYKVDEAEGYLINPRILSTNSTEEKDNEGCLSFPGIFVAVARPTHIDVMYHDAKGMPFTKSFDGLAARVIQHEMDHLEGLTLLSHLSKLKRDVVHRKMVKQQKKFNELQHRLGKQLDHALRAQDTLDYARLRRS